MSHARDLVGPLSKASHSALQQGGVCLLHLTLANANLGVHVKIK